MPLPVTLAFAAVFGLAGLLEAQRFQKVYGRSPWGWHPAIWAVLLGLVWPVGLVLLAVAERVGRARSAKTSSPGLGLPTP